MIETIVIDALAWATWSVVAGAVGSKLPDRMLTTDTFVTRKRAFENGGRLYERLRIRDWKDRVPECGAVFGGRSKATLGGRGQLPAFALETRRAEYVHWALLGVAPSFALWNPPLLTLAMIAYGVGANVPFIMIQRYNRLRAERVMAR